MSQEDVMVGPLIVLQDSDAIDVLDRRTVLTKARRALLDQLKRDKEKRGLDIKGVKMPE